MSEWRAVELNTPDDLFRFVLGPTGVNKDHVEALAAYAKTLSHKVLLQMCLQILYEYAAMAATARASLVRVMRLYQPSLDPSLTPDQIADHINLEKLLSPQEVRKALCGGLNINGRPVNPATLRKNLDRAEQIMRYILSKPGLTGGNAAKKFGFKEGKHCWKFIDDLFKKGHFEGELLDLYHRVKATRRRGRPPQTKKKSRPKN
jgi:hypothetical protein